MIKLYGKNDLKAKLDNIAAQGRLSHAIMLHGENGSGRLTTALYIAKLLMCSAPPCDNCPICKRIDEQTHPDVIFPLRECGGKYSAASIRDVLAGTIIMPNDGDLKIYIFEAADTMITQIQNSLLKLIEEPASHIRFIFICENINAILTTILSRVTEYEVPMPSIQDCTDYLISNGTEPSRAKELAELTSGNIGKCIEILEGADELKLIETAKKAAAALVKKDGMMLLAALSEQTNRAEFAIMLEYFAGILRDALACRCGVSLSSCGKDEAKMLAKAYDEASIVAKLESTLETISHGKHNLNLALTAAQLTSKLGSR